jgi:hypothetical protein
LIFSENLTKYTKTIQEIFEKLRKNKHFINLKKYNFGTNIIEFLGFIIKPKKTKIDLLLSKLLKISYN